MVVAKSLSVVPRGHAGPRVIFGIAIPLRIQFVRDALWSKIVMDTEHVHVAL